MQAIQNIRPISDFNREMEDVLSDMDHAPVILASRSKPRAVLVNVEQWNHTARELEDLREVFRLLETEFKDEPNKYTIHELLGLVQARRAVETTTKWTSGAELRKMAAAANG